MAPTRRRFLWVGALSLSGLGGCTLTRPGATKDTPAAKIGATGHLVEARRCRLDVIILTRPQNDSILNDALWHVADEQALSPELRRAWHVNGLRIGRVTGDLPLAVGELLNAGPPNQPDVQTIDNPTGEPIRIDPTHADPRPSVNLLLTDPSGNVKGKPYQLAKGYLRVIATHQGADGVSLKFTPELHHGPFQQGIGVLPAGSLPAPREFQYTNSQREESFRDLAVEFSLEPGQIIALGAWPGRPESLGDILFHKLDTGSDRVLQSVVLIWARASRESPPPAANISRVPPNLMPVTPEDLHLKAPAP